MYDVFEFEAIVACLQKFLLEMDCKEENWIGIEKFVAFPLMHSDGLLFAVG